MKGKTKNLAGQVREALLALSDTVLMETLAEWLDGADEWLDWSDEYRNALGYRLQSYEKGYKGYREDVCKPMEIDYRLSNPTKITKVASASDSATLSTSSAETGQGV